MQVFHFFCRAPALAWGFCPWSPAPAPCPLPRLLYQTADAELGPTHGCACPPALVPCTIPPAQGLATAHGTDTVSLRATSFQPSAVGAWVAGAGRGPTPLPAQWGWCRKRRQPRWCDSGSGLSLECPVAPSRGGTPPHRPVQKFKRGWAPCSKSNGHPPTRRRRQMALHFLPQHERTAAAHSGTRPGGFQATSFHAHEK